MNISPFYISSYIDMPLYCRDEMTNLMGKKNDGEFVNGWVFYGPATLPQEDLIELHSIIDPSKEILKKLEARKETDIQTFFDKKFWRYIKDEEGYLPVPGLASIVDDPQEILEYGCELLEECEYQISSIDLKKISHFDDDSHDIMNLITILDDGAFTIETPGTSANHCALKFFTEAWVANHKFHKPSLSDIYRGTMEFGRDEISPFIRMSLPEFRNLRSFKKEYVVGNEIFGMVYLERKMLQDPNFSPATLTLREGDFRILID